MKRLCNSLLLNLVVLVVAGCGGDDDGGSPARPEPPAAGAPIAGGGLAVQEAIDSELDGPLMVKGFVVQTGDEVRVCSALAESFPPQCGGERLRVIGLDPGSVPDLEEANGVRWAEAAQVYGVVAAG